MVAAKSFAEVPGPVNYVRKVAYTVRPVSLRAPAGVARAARLRTESAAPLQPPPLTLCHVRRCAAASVRARAVRAQVPEPSARTQQLVSTDGDASDSSAPAPLNAAEEARCVGLLHACQTWLELKDGEKNSIVITSPADDTKELVNHNIVLPKSGAAIPSKTWGVMQEACKYGLSDLKSCDKPTHWPECSGAECHTDAAVKREDARAKSDSNDETTLVSDSSASSDSAAAAAAAKATKRTGKRRSKGKRPA